MPAGQAHTTWFSELKIMLKEKWEKNYSIPKQFELVEELNSELSRIRKEGNMKPPVIWCSSCKKKHQGVFTNISITSTYFALEKEGIINHSDFLTLKREWNKYSKMKGIDVYGENKTEIKEPESTT